MKAILVIDVNDDINFEEARAKITMQEDRWGLLLGNARKKWYDNVQLKPLPERDNGMYALYSMGWNDFLDEILGEEEL